jgi:hypothetical protein
MVAESGARERRAALAAALGVLVVLAAVAVYTFRNVGCFPGSDALKAARYADCLRNGDRVGSAALAALAAGAVLVAVGGVCLMRQRCELRRVPRRSTR